MPDRSFSHFNPKELVFEDSNGIAADFIVRLKRKDTDGRWAPRAPFASPGVIRFPPIRFHAVTELFGFYVRATLNDGGIGFQLSADLGVTWLRWDGAAWVSDGSFSTDLEIDEGLPSFPLDAQDKTLTIRVKLTASSDLQKTPAIVALSVF